MAVRLLRPVSEDAVLTLLCFPSIFVRLVFVIRTIFAFVAVLFLVVESDHRWFTLLEVLLLFRMIFVVGIGNIAEDGGHCSGAITLC